MPRQDYFDSERSRVQRTLEILEYCADRLDSRAFVPMPVLADLVEFIDASEEAVFEVNEVTTGRAASCRLGQDVRARVPLEGMRQALDIGPAPLSVNVSRRRRSITR